MLQAEEQTEDLCVLSETWFCSLSSQPMEMFRNISTQPFPELYCGALRVFTVSVCVFTVCVSVFTVCECVCVYVSECVFTVSV